VRRWASDLARAWLNVMFVAAAVALVMAVSGGFGTGVLQILPRILYWLVLFAIGALMGVLTGRRVMSRPWLTCRPWLGGAIVTACITPPMALVAWIGNTLLRHIPLSLSILLIDVLPSTLAVCAAITGLAILVRVRGPAQTHAAAAGAAPPKFLARLPAKLKGADIWAVEAQDHYLRLHTSKGRDLILMRLSDAIAELEGIEGARTHRSWWVARAAVVEAVRAEGRATLTLIDGQEVPVSRGYVGTLREAGWV